VHPHVRSKLRPSDHWQSFVPRAIVDLRRVGTDQTRPQQRLALGRLHGEIDVGKSRAPTLLHGVEIKEHRVDAVALYHVLVNVKINKKYAWVCAAKMSRMANFKSKCVTKEQWLEEGHRATERTFLNI